MVHTYEKQYRIEQMADHLIDRDDYFGLTNPEDFLEWGFQNMSRFYDAHTVDNSWVEEFDIDALFDAWMKEQNSYEEEGPSATISCNVI